MLRSTLLIILFAFSGSVYADGFSYNSVTASYGQIDFDDLNADGDILSINGSAAIGESFFVFGGFGMADISDNVVSADVSVITSISLDHTTILGDTIGEIAWEKAGIIKSGGTVVIAPQRTEALSVILDVCRKRSAIPIQVGKEVTWSP